MTMNPYKPRTTVSLGLEREIASTCLQKSEYSFWFRGIFALAPRSRVGLCRLPTTRTGAWCRHFDSTPG